jgi:lysophospholipase L1-like esterase
VIAAGVRWFGRVDTTDPMKPKFAWSGSGFVARFSGTSLTMQTVTGNVTIIYKTVIDGVVQAAFTTKGGMTTSMLATGLDPSMPHTVELYRQTEGGQGDTQLLGLTVGDGALMDPPPGPARLIEVIGDSISAGYGTLGTPTDGDCFPTESHWDTYEAVAARMLTAETMISVELSTIAASGRGMYRNYGDTVVPGPGTLPQLYDHVLTNEATPVWDFHIQPDAVVINLGTNDANTGDPGMPFEDAYTAFLQTVRGHYPDAYIMCIIGPLLSDGSLTAIQGHIRNVVNARIAAGDARIEFFDQIAAQTTATFACQAHPNPIENTTMGTQLATELRARLGW